MPAVILLPTLAGKKRATASRECHKLMQLGQSHALHSCCLQRQRADLDLQAELGDLSGQAPGFDRGGTAIEMVGSKIVVFGAILQHVVDCGKHRSGHGADRLLRAVPAA
jgi:hypothetical protein